MQTMFPCVIHSEPNGTTALKNVKEIKTSPELEHYNNG